MVCFHKAGPYLDMPFELSTLQSIIKPYDQEVSLFLMLPVPEDALQEERSEVPVAA